MAPATQQTSEDVTVEFVADGLDPIIGLTLDGRFRVVGSVGKGAMGTVYKAIQEPLNRTVALKVLDSNYGAGRDETFRQRFLVEAALTAKLSHPNTVRIIDYGCTKDGLFYLAMEYLAGATLDRVLQHGGLSWRRVAAITLQVARALREAHDLGVVHRDLKPANIMVLNADNDADYVKVLDFGLVKSFIEGRELEGRAITQHGMLMGSPPYMAPEQGDKNRADPRSDIYSLGIVMYEALTGKPPFTGNGPLEIILKHVNHPVPPMVTPDGVEVIPEAMAALVYKCLSKSPMDRFQSMEELIAGLQTMIAVPVMTPAPDEIPMVSDFVDVPPRHRTGLMAMGFLGALAIGIAGTALVLHKPAVKPVEAVTTVVPAAPVAVQFHVDSEPRGAQVEVDGRTMGLTPASFSLPAGERGRASAQVRLSMNGFAPMTVTAAGKGTVEVMQTLVAVLEPVVQAPAPVVAPVVVQPPEMKKAPVRVAAPKETRTRGKQHKAAAVKPVSKLNDEDEPVPHVVTPPVEVAPVKVEKDELKRPL